MDERRVIAANALARLGNVSEAARIAGVDRTTLHRWLRDEEFRSLLERLEGDLFTHLVVNTMALQEPAWHALRRALDRPVPPTVLAAARFSIELSLRLAERDRRQTVTEILVQRLSEDVTLSALRHLEPPR